MVTRNNEVSIPVPIYVDSQAALKALKSSTIKSKVVFDCRRSLENAVLSIKLFRVPVHYNITGNETADELARLGSELTTIEVKNSLKPPLCHFLQVIHKHYSERIQQKWLDERECNISKRIWSTLSEKRIKSLLSLSKPDLKLVMGITSEVTAR